MTSSVNRTRWSVLRRLKRNRCKISGIASPSSRSFMKATFVIPSAGRFSISFRYILSRQHATTHRLAPSFTRSLVVIWPRIERVPGADNTHSVTRPIVGVKRFGQGANRKGAERIQKNKRAPLLQSADHFDVAENQ